MLGMSVTNMSAAVCSGLSTWPMPEGSAWHAFGTEGTCKSQAFFLQIGIAAPFYNLCLAIYYYLFIVRNAPSKRIVFAEKFMHPLCLIYGVGTAIAALALDIFGPASFWCWIERGENGENEVYRWCFWHGPLWAIIVIVTAFMVVIYRRLRKQDNIQRGWARRSTRPGSFLVLRRRSSAENVNDDEPTQPSETDGNRSSAPRNRQTVSNRRPLNASVSFKWQSMWYLGSFYLTWIFLTAVRGMQAAKKQPPYWLVLLAVTFSPALGFFNFIVYFRPRFKQHRQQHPDVGRLATFIEVSFPLCNCKGGTGEFSYSSRGKSKQQTAERSSNNKASSPENEGPSESEMGLHHTEAAGGENFDDNLGG